MTIYTYSKTGLASYSTIAKAISDKGITDAIVTLNGDLKVTVNSSFKTDLDAAIVNAAIGGLTETKINKINQVRANTGELASAGVSFGGGTLDLDYETRGRLRDLLNDANDGFVSLPMDMAMSSGDVAMTSTTVISNALQALLDRGLYLSSDDTNGDGSKGEQKLIDEINACTSITQVNAINDTRT